MKKYRALGNILFWMTLISPLFAFQIVCLVGEVDIFQTPGMIRYTWVMLFFISIGILSILMGIKLKKNKQKYKKNIIVAFICIPLLLIFGSYRLIFKDVVSYDVNKVSAIEKKVNVELPSKIKIATDKFNEYDVNYVKITDNECKKMFEQKVKNNLLWKNKLDFQIKALLPVDIQYGCENYDYFLFYNITDDEYNKVRSRGQYECIFIAYDCDLNRLLIIDGIKVDMD